MNIKGLIKGLLGESTIRYIQHGILLVKHFGKPDIEGNTFKVIQKNGYHTFFGYYDYEQFSTDDNKVLFHRIKKNADPLKDEATLCYYDIKEDKTVEITKTALWSWQQGARLSWIPNSNEEILYNDIVDGAYASVRYNIVTGKKLIYPMPLYDFDACLGFGLSLNFSRLQRLRPGYGYLRIADSTASEKAPENDGIFKIDFATGESKQLVSLADLAKANDKDGRYTHYINHISISPEGTKFSYFHLWVDEDNKWYTRLYVCTSDGLNNYVIEDTCKVSHYAWRDDNHILVTCYQGNEQFYQLINVNDCTKQRLPHACLDKDGHPSYIKSNLIITDTYPMNDSMQELFLCNTEKHDSKSLVAKVFHHPFLDGEKRCDLHPRLSHDKKMVCIDTTAYKKMRSCAIFKIVGENNE